jgi:hypothetical protein
VAPKCRGVQASWHPSVVASKRRGTQVSWHPSVVAPKRGTGVSPVGEKMLYSQHRRDACSTMSCRIKRKRSEQRRCSKRFPSLPTAVSAGQRLPPWRKPIKHLLCQTDCEHKKIVLRPLYQLYQHIMKIFFSSLFDKFPESASKCYTP